MLDGRKVDIKTNEGFAPLPADKYTVQIVDVNLVSQLKYQSTEEEEVLNYKFQVLDDNPMPAEEGAADTTETTKGRFLWKRCRLALNSRSHLGKLAAAVAGRTLTKEESEKFDPESIVGEQLDVMVEQNPSKKDPSVIFNNIISFIKTTKKLDPLPMNKREAEVVEKKTSSVPTTAPDVEAEKFVNNVESVQPELSEAATAEAEAAELEAAALEAKAKAARAKALAAKK